MTRRLPTLRRSSKPKRRPKLALLVYCEGKNTEPDYLNAFAREHGNQLVSLEIAQERGVPLTLVQAAVQGKRRQKRSKDSFALRDETWVVFDRDEHPHIAEAEQLARDHGIWIAFSNPCFEVWLLLHFDDFNAPDGRHEVQKKLSQVAQGYDPRKGKLCGFDKLAPGYDEAVRRAQRMRERRQQERAAKAAPYTDVDILTQRIKANGKTSRRATAD